MVESQYFLKEIAKNQKDSNFVISPVGLEVLLKVINQEPLSNRLIEFNKGIDFKKSFEHWVDDFVVILNSKTSVWHQEALELDESFKNWLTTHNEVGVNPRLPFSKETINEWVKTHSKGLVQGIISEEIDPMTIGMLINVLYFKASWKEFFYPDFNTEGDFYAEDGTSKKVTFMKKGSLYFPEDFLYNEDDFFGVIQLPYIKEGLVMELYLPKKGVAMSDFLTHFSTVDMKVFRSNFQMKECFLELPKFETQTKLSFDEIIENLGLINTENLKYFEGYKEQFVDNILQTTVINVSESDTEASSVTRGGIAGGMPYPTENPVIEFILNRPFAYIIRDNKTNTDIFTGIKRR